MRTQRPSALALPLVLEALPDAERCWVAEAAVHSSLRPSQVLAEAGEPSDGLWLLADAVAARLAVHRSGAVQETGLSGPGSLACAFAVVGSGVSPWRVEVRRGGAALRIRGDSLADLELHAPRLYRIAQGTAALEAAQLAADFAQRNSSSAQSWVARRLVDYFETFGDPVLQLTHKRLAQLLGRRRATVTLALQELEASRAIRARRGAIELLNAQRLAELAHEG